jgi:Fur family transcriptional regulator, peroxide stress response regulator
MATAHKTEQAEAVHEGSFRELCVAHGIAVTHQRQVLFEVMQSIPGHPSPEEVYARVQERIPSISLATVYKNIHLFIASGLFREVSMHHGSLRVEMNDRPHHHMVCTKCKAIFDLDENELGGMPQPHRMPNGFVAQRYAVDVLGLCAACQEPEALHS